MHRPLAVTVTKVVRRNFLTAAGRELRAREISARLDFERLVGARFITLTIDPRHGGAGEDEWGHAIITDAVSERCYEMGKRRLRAFFRFLRLGGHYCELLPGTFVTCDPRFRNHFGPLAHWPGLGGKIPYAWKLEFTERGLPHWHALFLSKHLVPWQVVSAAWGLGHIDIARVKDRRQAEYLFKYVGKSVSTTDDEDPGSVATDPLRGWPDWALDFRKGIRFWQASPHFYGARPPERNHAKKQNAEECRTTHRPFRTIRERLLRSPREIRVWQNGRPGGVCMLKDGVDFGHVLAAAASSGGEVPNNFRAELPIQRFGSFIAQYP